MVEERWVIYFLATFTAVTCALASSKCGYESCDLGKEGMINVHLVPHTHDDVGWLKTVDQYYVDEVQYILDSVVMALQANPARKFSYVETAFFYRWWRQQDDAMRHRVKGLVNNGQLSFILGGWCMNDEASTHYNAIIDQHTRGVQFLETNFGSCGRPRVAWQIDPFGHSREQASLFAQMGYDAVYFARIDYQDYARRTKAREMEMIWKGSDDISADLFTGALYGLHYGPPPGMNFDIYAQHNIQDDKRLHDYNVDEIVNLAIKDATEQNESFRGNHIAWLMGDDFNYQNAQTWYKNLDKLIELVNARQSMGSKVNLIYSNPTCYTLAKNKANITWPSKSDDFFPYAHRKHAYWTGYFTSRAAIKGMVRETNNFLQVVKQLDAMAQLGPEHSSDKLLDTLKQAMAVAQHHDAVSGTEKQVVAYDYELRLSAGIDQCMKVVNYAYQKLLTTNNPSFSFLPELELCPLVNISRCNATETRKTFTLMVYNPLGRKTSYTVKVPVATSSLTITDSAGSNVPAQFTPVSDRTKSIPERKGSTAPYDMIFVADLDALGYATFFVTPMKTRRYPTPELSHKSKSDIVVSNKYLSVTFDGKTGLMKEIGNIESKIQAKVSQQLLCYIGMRGNNSKPEFTASGAYLFRPNASHPYPLAASAKVTTIKGSLVQEVRQTFNEFGTQVIRLGAEARHLEIEWTVGPLPLANQGEIGREVISKFTSDLFSEGVFYTDANGRQMLQRQVNYRPTWALDVNEPIAGNYFPVNSRIYIQDLKRSVQLTVLTDRSEGGSSLSNGSIELMLHRTTIDDDALGVGEPLQEKGADGKGLIVRGRHYVLFDTITNSARLHRDLAERLYMSPLVTVSRADQVTIKKWQKQPSLKGSFSKVNLPDNVHLLTLENLSRNRVLLRLEHLYSKNEDHTLSQPVTVSLKDLFTELDVVSVREMTLEANQYLDEAQRLGWNGKSFDNRPPPVGSNLSVQLKPMMIRTFEVTIS